MILGRGEIEKLVRRDKILENFDEKGFTGAGYDLRIGRFYNTVGPSYIGREERKLPEVEEILEERVLLKPGEYILIETMEVVNIPPNLMARVENRSSVFRCGASTFNAIVDPGYHGRLTFGLKNISSHDFGVERGARIAQIVFEEIRGETEKYNGRYQGGRVV